MKKKRKKLDLETIIPILIGQWRRLHKLPGPPDRLQTREFRQLIETIQKMRSEKLTNYYFKDCHILGAYLLYDWVIHYQQGFSLLKELPTVPNRVLDVCSGAAPLAFAALHHGATEVFATDQSQEALNVGAQICGRYGFPLTIRKWRCTRDPLPIEGKFDLIILSHSINELFETVPKQALFVRSLLQKLTPEGNLLLIESSELKTNHRLLELRDLLVSENIPVQAPCVWKGKCPALESKSLCFAQREMEKPHLIKEIQRAANINLNSLKMTYFIIKHPDSHWPKLSIEPAYRVTSPPVPSFRGKRYYLCGTDGKKTLESRVSSKVFEYLKRGDLVVIQDHLVDRNAFEVIEGTKLQVLRNAG